MSDETAGGEATGAGIRPSSGKAARLQAERSGVLPEAIGSGKVLGTKLTDTLGAEMGYGVDGRTDLTFFGKSYIFAPVGLRDQEEAAQELERLNPTLLAFGMVKPGSPMDDITASDLAGMMRVLTANPNGSEMGACVNVTLLFYQMNNEERMALARLMWFGFKRWQKEITFDDVADFLDWGNMPVMLRLWFRKNLGVLDRFLQRLSQLLPPVPEILPADMTTPETVNPEEFAALMSEETSEEEGQEATPPEALEIPKEAPEDAAADEEAQPEPPPTEKSNRQ